MVKVGTMIFISGTTSVDENGNVIGIGDSYQQTKYILEKTAKTLEQIGTDLSSVTRTRIFTTKIDEWKEIGRAHAEYFKDIRPASTMVEVKRLVQPELVVEIELDAVVPETNTN